MSQHPAHTTESWFDTRWKWKSVANFKLVLWTLQYHVKFKALGPVQLHWFSLGTEQPYSEQSLAHFPIVAAVLKLIFIKKTLRPALRVTDSPLHSFTFFLLNQTIEKITFIILIFVLLMQRKARKFPFCFYSRKFIAACQDLEWLSHFKDISVFWSFIFG